MLTRTWKEAGDDNVGLLGAGVAFYLFLAFVPLLASVVLTYGLVADPETVSKHIQSLARTLPREAATIIADQLKAITGEGSSGKGLGLLIAIGVALYGASKGAGAIVTALNVAYEVKETRGFVARTLLSLTLTVGMVTMLMIAVTAVSAVGFIEKLLPFSAPMVHAALQILCFLLAGAVVSLGIALLYRYGPNRPDAPWRWVTPGSAAATLVWLLASFGFSLYVSNFGNYNATYGSLGGVVVFLTWLYLTGYILLMGGELNSELERQQAEKDSELAEAGGPKPGNAVDDPTKLTSATARADQVVAPHATLVAPPVAQPHRQPGGKGLASIGLLAGGAVVGALLRGRRKPPEAKHFHYPSEGGTAL